MRRSAQLWLVHALAVLALLAATPKSWAQDNEKALERAVMLVSAEPITRATAVIVFEPELRSAPVVQDPEALKAIVPHVVERPTYIERLPGDSWKVVAYLQPSDLKPKAKLTVLATTESGKSVVSPVQWLLPDEGAQNFGQLAEVRCSHRETSVALEKLLTKSVEDLQKLAGVRKQRRKLLEDLVRERLTPAALERLSVLEEQANAKNSVAAPKVTLSRSTALEELVERLLALEAVQDATYNRETAGSQD